MTRANYASLIINEKELAQRRGFELPQNLMVMRFFLSWKKPNNWCLIFPGPYGVQIPSGLVTLHLFDLKGSKESGTTISRVQLVPDPVKSADNCRFGDFTGLILFGIYLILEKN